MLVVAFVENWRGAGTFVAGALYFSAFGAAALVYFQRKVAARRERPPVEFRAMRVAGESLRGRIAERDEAALGRFCASAIKPITAFGVCCAGLLGLTKLAPPLWIFWSCVLLCLGLTAVFFWRAMKEVASDFESRRNEVLGYMGERFVADWLVPVARVGFYVYHDVPATAGNRAFNIDHVVVGKSGVWVIETKTRRKGRALPGRPDHKVVYDGQRLRWPWGEDRSDIDQVEANARWLEEFVQRLTGMPVEVNKIVALPGWWVEAVTKRHECRVLVLNPKNLPGEIVGRRATILTEEQVDLIARQLAELCRDVEWI